jgi:chromate transporter
MMSELLQFAYEFFKTGLFAVGGGLATLPFLYAMGAKTGWFTSGDVADMIAISESTPGPVGINMATYVGFTSFGILGALIGPLSLVLPSLIVIVVISQILNKFKEAQAVQDIFYGLRPASTGLIITAGIGVARIALLYEDVFAETKDILSLFNWKAILLAVGIYILTNNKKVKPHPILVIVIAAVVGVVFKF